MNKPRFILTNAAKRDLIGIAKFTAYRWGTVQRDKYLSRLDDAFQQLAGSPRLGTECDYIKLGYRKFPVGSHIVFYRIINQRIEIVRILHKHMDASKSTFQA